jgi:peptidoglycan hydrolase CwlO-like protein
MNYKLLYDLEKEAHRETFDKCNEEVIRLIKEKHKLQKEVKSLENELESIINKYNAEKIQKEEQEIKLIRVEYYA